MTNKRGQWAERLAEEHLVCRGLKLVQRNYTCQLGEIDLIMREQNTIVFVEVRYRNSEQYGGGIESIDFFKQRKLQSTAMHYLQNHDKHHDHPCRFDAMILGNQHNSASDMTINWIKNAF